MNTQIFPTYAAFITRPDKSINGVSPEFAQQHPQYEQDNASNKGCYNCHRCINCRFCTNCRPCTNCRSCTNCHYCTDCTNCTNCTDCHRCTNCRSCTSCRSRTNFLDGRPKPTRRQASQKLGAPKNKLP